ncbi:MAG: hypothetical protein ACRDI2_21010, partial [Chloroflexota bacterium]
EHKVRLPIDVPESQAIYRLCGELGLPVLLHFEYRNYNYNVEAFEQVLRAHPATVFIGHAQAWWANVSAAVPRDPDARPTSLPPTSLPPTSLPPTSLTTWALDQYRIAPCRPYGRRHAPGANGGAVGRRGSDLC